MKKLPALIVLPALLSFGLSPSAWGENPQTEADLQTIKESLQDLDREIDTLTATQQPPIAQLNPADYNGKEVIDAKGDDIGDVEKLVIKTDDNQAYAVVSVGGFMGIGSQKVAIALENLQPRGSQLLLSTSISTKELKDRMRYEESEFSAFELNSLK